MRASPPLIFAVIFLGVGLGLIFGYGTEASGFNVTYPFSSSTLHLDVTTTGPAVLGGMAAAAIGVLLLAWAFVAAIVSLFTESSYKDRILDRYSITPKSEDTEYFESTAPGEQGHTWSRQDSRPQI